MENKEEIQMNLKPQSFEYGNAQPKFLRDFKNLEWTVGNVTLDSSKLSEGDVVEAGTAVFRNDESGLYELVAEDTPETMSAPVLTGYQVVVKDAEVNESVASLRKASVYEELLHGVTDNFKSATQGRIVYDI